MENNKYLSIDQTKQLLDKRPAGTSPQEILSGLQARGYTVEGLSAPTPTTKQPEAPKRSSYEIAMGINEPIEKRNERNTKVAGFLGFDKLARGIGYTAANATGNQDKVIDANKMAMDIQGHLVEEIKDKKAKGEDTTRMEHALVDLTNSIKETAGKVDDIGTDGLSNKDVLGSAIQTASLFIPTERIAAGLAANGVPKLASKVAAGAATGYAFDTGAALQDENKTTAEAFKPSIGTATGAALPVVGAALQHLIINPLSKIIKGLGSGVSGASTQSLDDIIKNPEIAQQADEALKQGGNAELLKKHAETIVNGVSNIKKEARTAYGEAIQGLKATDIKPEVFRSKVQPLLDKYGSSTEGNLRSLSNVEFESPANIEKANSIINKISDTNLDGNSLKKTIDYIESKKFGIANSDERLSFNAFINDVSSGLKSAINESTDKLGEMNANYTKDMQLAESIEQIFGKVKFKNMKEVNVVSQKLENLFNQKGLSPDYVEKFLKRIGVSPEGFKTEEAVRQISNKELGVSNDVGLKGSEIIKTITSSMVTPKMVKDIAIATGKSQAVIKKILSNTKSPAFKLLLSELEAQK